MSGLELELHETVCRDSDEDVAVHPRSGGEVVDMNEGSNEARIHELEKKLLEQVVYSEEEAYMLYCDYAQAMGFNVRRGKQYYFMGTRRVRSKTYCCSKEGVKDDKADANGAGYKKAETRTGCKATISFSCDDSGQWKVSRFEKEHNHEMAPQYIKPSMKSGQAILAANVYGSGGALDSLFMIGLCGRCLCCLPLAGASGYFTAKSSCFFLPPCSLICLLILFLQIYESEPDKIRELSLQLAMTKNRAETFERQAATYKRQLDMIFEHIEEHNQSLSKKIQTALNNVKKLESQDRQKL